jgi:hypothetical protein
MSSVVIFQLNLQHRHGSHLESVGLEPHRYVVLNVQFLSDGYLRVCKGDD